MRRQTSHSPSFPPSRPLQGRSAPKDTPNVGSSTRPTWKSRTCRPCASCASCARYSRTRSPAEPPDDPPGLEPNVGVEGPGNFSRTRAAVVFKVRFNTEHPKNGARVWSCLSWKCHDMSMLNHGSSWRCSPGHRQKRPRWAAHSLVHSGGMWAAGSAVCVWMLAAVPQTKSDCRGQLVTFC